MVPRLQAILGGMNANTRPLQQHSLVLCPHCRRWHPVSLGHTTGTPYTVAMLYFMCRGGRYYAGQLGQTSRDPTRSPRPDITLIVSPSSSQTTED